MRLAGNHRELCQQVPGPGLQSRIRASHRLQPREPILRPPRARRPASHAGVCRPRSLLRACRLLACLAAGRRAVAVVAAVARESVGAPRAEAEASQARSLAVAVPQLTRPHRLRLWPVLRVRRGDGGRHLLGLVVSVLEQPARRVAAGVEAAVSALHEPAEDGKAALVSSAREASRGAVLKAAHALLSCAEACATALGGRWLVRCLVVAADPFQRPPEHRVRRATAANPVT